MREITLGDLVNNIENEDYNHGVVVETHVSITDELIATGACFELADLEGACGGFEPPGARVMWESGEFNIHYFDELEVIHESKRLV